MDNGKSLKDRNWIEFDEASDVIASLKLFGTCLEGLPGNAGSWKWAIISLHSATTGAIVCELSGSAAIGALVKKVAEKTLQYHESNVDGMRPKPRIATTRELAKRLANPEERLERKSYKLNIEPAQLSHYEWLSDFRNNFMHFSPKGWSIETSRLDLVFTSCLSIIHQINIGGWAFRHLDEEQAAHLTELIESARAAVKPS